MKRIAIILLLLCNLSAGSVFSEEIQEELPTLPNIFIWQLPEDEDDVKANITDSTQGNSQEEITLTDIPKSTVQPLPFSGYAEYGEASDAIYLTNEHNNNVLNIRVPQKFESKKLVDSKKIKKNQYYSNYNSEEYSIAPQSLMAVEKKGGFSYGTLFNSGIDNAQLERSTTLFTRYETQKFALSSAYKKNNLTTRGLDTDNFYLAPELKLNRIFSLSEVLSADVTRNRRKGELVLSIKPTKDENLLFEVGAGTTYDLDSDRSWSQVNFSTKFKL